MIVALLACAGDGAAPEEEPAPAAPAVDEAVSGPGGSVFRSRLSVPFRGAGARIPAEQVGHPNLLVWNLAAGTEVLAPMDGTLLYSRSSAHCRDSSDLNGVRTIALFGPGMSTEPYITISGVAALPSGPSKHVSRGEVIGTVLDSQCPGVALAAWRWDASLPLSMEESQNSAFDVTPAERARPSEPGAGDARHLVFGRYPETAPVPRRLTAVPFDTLERAPLRTAGSTWARPTGSKARSALTGRVGPSDVRYRCPGETESRSAFEIRTSTSPSTRVVYAGVDRTVPYGEVASGGSVVGRVVCEVLWLGRQTDDGLQPIDLSDPQTSWFQVSGFEWTQLTGELDPSGPQLEIVSVTTPGR